MRRIKGTGLDWSGLDWTGGLGSLILTSTERTPLSFTCFNFFSTGKSNGVMTRGGFSMDMKTSQNPWPKGFLGLV